MEVDGRIGLCAGAIREKAMNLVEKTESRASALRELANWPWISSEGREALLAAADLYSARAQMMRTRMIA